MFLKNKNHALLVFLLLTCASIPLMQSTEQGYKKKVSKQEIVNSFAPGVVQIYTQHGIYDFQCPYKTASSSFGRGTGFFILYDNHYYIVTNHHVVQAAMALKIQLPAISQELMDVEIVSLYPEKDLAILSLTAKSYDKIVSSLGSITPLDLGDSDKAQKAQKTIALGYPIGGDTLKSTIGVISGHEFVNNQHMIQIDTPINPGNSGGPLFNDSGEVIGINTAGIREAQNIGYAIPINILKDNLAIMQEQFLIKKPYLGFLSINIGSTYAAMVGNPLPHGIYMAQIIKGSVFDSLGIQKGDMLYEIDGYAIDQYGDIAWHSNGNIDRMSIYSYVSRMIPDQKIRLVYYRNGIRHETCCAINANEGPVPTLYPPYQMLDYEVFGGLVITPLTANHINLPNSPFAALKKYQFLGKPRIIVSHVLKESELGLLRVVDAGLLIKSINGMPVKTMDDVRHAIMISAQTGTWVVEFFSNQYNIGKFTIAFPLTDMLNEYQKLGKTNGYTPSQTIKDLRLLI